MTQFALLPGFDPRANVDFKPATPSKPSKHLNAEPSRPLSPPPPLRRGAISDADIERHAIQGEEHAAMASPEAHAEAVRALQRAALPFPGTVLHGIPDAYGCGRCGRGIWVSPSWPGPPPSLCWTCEREAAQ